MVALFDRTESAYTATALNITLTPAVSYNVDFSKWGNPERAKINACVPAVNKFLYQRRGVI